MVDATHRLLDVLVQWHRQEVFKFLGLVTPGMIEKAL